MPTYVYETIPSKTGRQGASFELYGTMRESRPDEAPETGEPVRRVISGGYGTT